MIPEERHGVCSKRRELIKNKLGELNVYSSHNCDSQPLSSTLRIFFLLASDAGPKDRRFRDDAHGLFDGSGGASKGAERYPSFFPE